MSTEAIRDLLRHGSFAEGDQVRDRTIAIARREIEARSTRRRPSSPGRRRALIALASVGALVALTFTPAGEAASGWLGRLVGIGEVGGPPTVEPRSGGTPLHPPLVIGNGHAPDGTRYEVVEYTTEKHGLCFALSFPHTDTRLAGSECSDGQPIRAGLANGIGMTFPDAHTTPRTVWAQGVVSSDTARVRARYRTGQGQTGTSAAAVAVASPDIRQRIGTEQRAGFFVVFVPRDADPLNGGRLALTAYRQDGTRIGAPFVVLPGREVKR